jgi:hypothetical protein
VGQNKKSNIGEILSLRTQWEDIVFDFTIDSDRKTGTIDNLKWFIDKGAVGNRFRTGFDEAINIAEQIIKGV